MKLVLQCVLMMACVAIAVAEDAGPPPQFGPLHILEVGINGEYANGQPTSVRLRVGNPQAQPLTLDLRLHAEYHPSPRRLAYGAGDTFTKPVALGPGEQREVEVPVTLPVANKELWVEASATTPGGQVIGYDRIVGDKLTTRSPEGNVGLLCATEETCKDAQAQVQFSGTMEERVEKNKKLHFTILREPREQWWVYGGFQVLVMAAPTAGSSAKQRAAMEYFLRRGGRLVVVENEITDPEFLSAYREGPPGTPIQVSRGKLYRVPSLQSQALGEAFTGGALTDLVNASPFQSAWMPDRGNQAMTWLRRHAATQFTFPRLRWLLIWLAIYILVIGFVNFSILRRVRRLEWGWLTIIAGALIFAAGFYVSSSRHRPKQFTLDDLAIYWMDQRSAEAYADYGVRVSAPRRATLKLMVDDAAWWWPKQFRNTPTNVAIGAEIREQQVAPGIEINLGPPQQVELSLLRWSFADENFEGARRFAGPLREFAPGRVRNETGVALKDAVVVDYAAKKIWSLGGLAPGAEVLLADIKPEALNLLDQSGVLMLQRAGGGQPAQLSLTDLVRTTTFGNRLQRIAVGLSGGPTLAADVGGVRCKRRDEALLVVFQ